MKKESNVAVAPTKSATPAAPRTSEEKANLKIALAQLADKPTAKADKEVKSEHVAAKAAMGVVKYEKALKWKYPEETTTARDRKVFRAKYRKEIRTLMLDISKLTPETPDHEKKSKDLARLKKRVLLVPETEF